MLQKMRERMGREEGFTLIELLVVMLILGILAAIAIPSFFNQRDKARDASAKEQARTAETAMETYATSNNGNYDSGTVTGATLHGIESTLVAAGLTVSTPSGAGPPADTAANSYAVTATSSTGNTFTVTRHADGSSALSCTASGNAGCPTGGNSW